MTPSPTLSLASIRSVGAKLMLRAREAYRRVLSVSDACVEAGEQQAIIIVRPDPPRLSMRICKDEKTTQKTTRNIYLLNETKRRANKPKSGEKEKTEERTERYWQIDR